MWNLLVYKGLIAILIVGLAGASGVATYFYNQQSTKIFQASDLNNQVNQLEGQISALNSQITALNQTNRLAKLTNFPAPSIEYPARRDQ